MSEELDFIVRELVDSLKDDICAVPNLYTTGIFISVAGFEKIKQALLAERHNASISSHNADKPAMHPAGCICVTCGDLGKRGLPSKPAMRSAEIWAIEGQHTLINGKYLSRQDHEKFIERIQRDAIASQRAEPEGWQQIETAPRDGTEILVCRGKSQGVVWWNQFSEKWNLSGMSYFNNPTRWMHLPAAPTTE